MRHSINFKKLQLNKLSAPSQISYSTSTVYTSIGPTLTILKARLLSTREGNHLTRVSLCPRGRGRSPGQIPVPDVGTPILPDGGTPLGLDGGLPPPPRGNGWQLDRLCRGQYASCGFPQEDFLVVSSIYLETFLCNKILLRDHFVACLYVCVWGGRGKLGCTSCLVQEGGVGVPVLSGGGAELPLSWPGVPSCEQTHTCENNTCRRTTYAGGNYSKGLFIHLTGVLLLN